MTNTMTTRFTQLWQIIQTPPQRAALKVCQGPAGSEIQGNFPLQGCGLRCAPLVSMEMLAPCRLGSWQPQGLGEHGQGPIPAS